MNSVTELKKVNSFYNSAANKTDQKNIMAIKKEVEKFIDDNIDNFLFTGNKNSIADLKTDELKKKFFNYVDANYKAKDEEAGGMTMTGKKQTPVKIEK